MMGPSRREVEAAERALEGARDGASRRDVARRERWETLLAPLALGAPAVEPPPGMFERVRAAIARDAAEDRARRAERRARSWAGAAAALGALAAAAVALVLLAPGELLAPQPGPGSRYVSVLTPGGGGPALVLEVDVAEGTATLRPVGLAAPEGRALELWRVPAEGPPVSLGLLAEGGRFPLEEDRPGWRRDAIAVSVEPPGGSPTGAPTGEVILSGPLVPSP